MSRSISEVFPEVFFVLDVGYRLSSTQPTIAINLSREFTGREFTIYRTAIILLPNIIFQLMSETEAARKCYPKSGIEGLRNEVSVGVPKYSVQVSYRTATILLPNIIFQLMSETEAVRKCYPKSGIEGLRNEVSVDVPKYLSKYLPNIIFQLMSETEAVRKCYPKSGIEGLRNEVSVDVPKYLRD